MFSGDAYFDWLCDRVVDEERYSQDEYRSLLKTLYEKPFYAVDPRDDNRIGDALGLRRDFEYETGLSADIGDCSILEIMVALAARCEETIMNDLHSDMNCGKWFYRMMDSLGVLWFRNRNFSRRDLNDILERFLNRQYSENGQGGLFTVHGRYCDMRKVEIWYQMCWYLDQISDFEV